MSRCFTQHQQRGYKPYWYFKIHKEETLYLKNLYYFFVGAVISVFDGPTDGPTTELDIDLKWADVAITQFSFDISYTID